MNIKSIHISVSPGICGFPCQVRARRVDRHKAAIEIAESECELIQKLSENLHEVTIQDIFAPHSKNPVFIAAERAGCHLTCTVPLAVLKATEVALELALPQEARISFMYDEKGDAG